MTLWFLVIQKQYSTAHSWLFALLNEESKMATEKDPGEIDGSKASSDDNLLGNELVRYVIRGTGTGAVKCPECGVVFESNFRISVCPNGHEFDVVRRR